MATTIFLRVFKIAIKAAAALAILAIITVVVLLGALWLDHTRETAFPALTGPFAVGRTTRSWTDPVHEDTMAPRPGTNRELIAWIWYPAAPRKPSQDFEDYMPPPWRTAMSHRISPLFSKFVWRDGSKVRAHSLHDADVSPLESSYPVVLIRPGAAALTTEYTVLAEDLASHGYVVAGIDAPYRSFVYVGSDGRVIARTPQDNAELASGAQQVQLATRLAQAWSADLSFTLDKLQQLNASDPSGRFNGRLDLNRVGIFGHSLGGATALEFCRSDARCKAGIDIDGLPLGRAIDEGVTQPFLFLLSDHSREPEAETRAVMANFRKIFDRLPDGRRWWITIRGAGHYRFADGAMTQAPLLTGALHALGVMHLDGRRQVAIATHSIDTFFDVYLKGAPATELNAQAEYPEAEYVH